MSKRIVFVTFIGALGLASPGRADVGFALAAQVRELCGIDRVTVSAGRQPTVVVHSRCNADAYRLTFVDLPENARIEAVQGNAKDALVKGTSIIVQSRRPGLQTAVVKFGRDVDPALLNRISLEVF